MKLNEDWSSGLQLAVVQASWVAWSRCPVHHEISQHLAPHHMVRWEIQLKLYQLHYHLAMLPVALGLWSMALSEYE
jgi:hypothetical protein